LKIGGTKASREASFYVQPSCHPYTVRTFEFVQSSPDLIMLLQECAPHRDLSNFLQENVFKPDERVLWKIFEQISDTMICLADNGIVHGDLARKNVLVFQYQTNNPDKNLVN
jgi:tRNA A-37 threonylcarbamoyl transferase component Bud32